MTAAFFRTLSTGLLVMERDSLASSLAHWQATAHWKPGVAKRETARIRASLAAAEAEVARRAGKGV